jgi:hypothetical protein
VPVALRRDYAIFRKRFEVPASDAMLMAGMAAWANVMGAINLELFGHLHNVIDTPGRTVRRRGGHAGPPARSREPPRVRHVEPSMNRATSSPRLPAPPAFAAFSLHAATTRRRPAADVRAQRSDEVVVRIGYEGGFVPQGTDVRQPAVVAHHVVTVGCSPLVPCRPSSLAHC